MPSVVRLVGLVGGDPDPAGTFEVVVRKLNGELVNAAAVVVDLTHAPDLAFAADQHDPGVLQNCESRTVRVFTNVLGSARFTLVGRGVHATDGVGVTTGVDIYANGVRLASDVRATSFDLDGVEGLGANDLSVWFEDFGSAADPARSDFNADGVVGAADLSLWLGAFGEGAFQEPLGPLCL